MDPFLDPRFYSGIQNFNSGNFYEAHDLFEDLWHECDEPKRRWIHGIVQISVAMHHHSTGNLNGSLLLLAEGMSRMRRAQISPIGFKEGEFLEPCLEILKLLQANMIDSNHSPKMKPEKHQQEISLPLILIEV
ncbi:MAG: DUF309 domain-containing protein [Synechococcaceae bacterium WBA_2_066]|nr:DUF309 domain-containing protein [Synechococcaceae bacterium WB6_1B_055]NBQ18439.1 DUF309 domain-containing protein [Synechococcaceae bacterium WB5_2A_257]NBY58800.1 DUF309 domain-containing protein [Synechococcaceae bacterium LLD_019]NCU76141.1 DUF309 domain-containing protein [Synechococcaceae bacterium WB7_1C_051]NCU90689.1 DUF309 domain-containing protein [Synechococcaceae bacterium WB7_1B_046]NCY14282.1 DUF309 domain-containing protein [Synechococcaceae bacterium WB8_1A_041]NDA74714.1